MLNINLPPGNVLQNMYIKHRLKKHDKKRTFIEVGCGNGNISSILLAFNMNGVGFDLNKKACDINRTKNTFYIKRGKYIIKNLDFFRYNDNDKVDIIITSHTLEHFSDDFLKMFFDKCKTLLDTNGIIISIVPSNMKCWGIEDETVGHYKRFEFNEFINIADDNGFTIHHLVGLTYPVSNLLLGLSNYLVNKSDKWKKNLNKEKQTKLSSPGAGRQIKFKTNFPHWFKYCCNEVTMYPFFILQKWFKKNENSLVIYCEYKIK